MGQGDCYQAEPEHQEFFRLLRLYAQAGRMVQLSEVSIVVGCERVLDGIPWEVARPGTEFRRALGRASVPRAAYHTRNTPATVVRGGRRGFPRAQALLMARVAAQAVPSRGALERRTS